MLLRRLVSFVCKFNICTRLDGCRYFHVQDFFDFFQSSIGQDLAIFGIDFSVTAALWTDSLALHNAKWGTDLLGNSSVSLTGFTGFSFCTADFFESAVGNLFGHSRVGFFETDIYGNLDVFTALCVFSPRSSAKSATKNTPHNISYIKISEIKSSLTSKPTLASKSSES